MLRPKKRFQIVLFLVLWISYCSIYAEKCSVSGVKFLRLFSDYRNGLVSRVALLSVSIYLSSRPYSPLTKRESVSSWKSVKVENVQIHSIVNSVDNGQIFGFEQNVCNAPLVCWGSVTIFSSVICGASKGTFSALSLIIKCVKVYSINTVTVIRRNKTTPSLLVPE